MGRDKATLLFEGVPMAVRVANSLRSGGCSTVVAVGGDRQELGPLGLVVVSDAVAGIGPIGGLLAALQHGAERGAVVTMSCDVPRLTGEAVRSLLAALAPGVDVAVAFTDRRQPVCAAWRPGLSAVVGEAVEGGERRIWKVLEGLAVVEVPIDPRVLANMNTPSDLND